MEATVNGVHRGEGYQVLEAADGQQALTVIEGASRVDLVITDVAMPALSGRFTPEILAAKVRQMIDQAASQRAR